MKRYIILKTQQPIQKYSSGGVFNSLNSGRYTSGYGILPIQKKQFGGMMQGYGTSSINLAPQSLQSMGINTKELLPMSGMSAPDGNWLSGFGDQLKSGLKSGAGVAMGADLVGNLGNMIGQRIIEKNKKEYTNEFGLINPDTSAMTKSGFVSGAMRGLSAGAKAGAMGGPVVSGILSGLGFIFGGIFGRKKAQREAEEAQKKFDEDYATAHAGAVRNADLAAAQALSRIQTPTNLTQLQPRQLKLQAPVFKKGGKIAEPGATNIITKGKLHKENNNLGNKDKGVPVVSADGKKEYEVEKEELILRRDATLTIEDMINQYNKTSDESILEKLGSYVAEELLNNTQDNSNKYKVKVENED